MNKIFLVFVFLTLLVLPLYSQVAVIAHTGTPITEIKKSQLLDFYTGDIRVWSNGGPVKVFDLKLKGKVRDDFYKYLGKSSSRMKSLWMKRMLSGEGDPPEALLSGKEMVGKVAATPGAIGFVNLVDVNKSIKVLLVIE